MGTVVLNGATSGSTTVQPTDAVTVTVTLPSTTGTLALTPTTYTGRYLLVAGGGGAGGIAGGGGGGGFIDNYFVYTKGTVYTCTVGAGGGADNAGASSSLVSNDPYNVNITAWFGGAVTKDGGSGGGGARARDNAGQTDGGNCVVGQGYRGGRGSGLTGAYGSGGGTDGFGVGAGGGGAGARGNDAQGSANGAGGVGRASTIISNTIATTYSVGQVSGSDVYFSGGGGGGGYGGTNNPAAGGTGGGGAGYGSNSTNGVSGTANTGGGGGGAGLSGTAGSGGSGVVILSVPTANYTGTYTGTPSITTYGSNTILIFKSSGTYTA